MTRARRIALSTTVAFVVVVPVASAGTLLRLTGIGPLTLGMKGSAAVSTGWLAGRSKGCELAYPKIPTVWSFTGPNAPAGLRGTTQFSKDSNRLTAIVVTAGARTAAGVTVGSTKTARMAARYRDLGYTVKAAYDRVFQGTFVRVSKNGKDLLEGFGEHGTVSTLGVPAIPACE